MTDGHDDALPPLLSLEDVGALFGDSLGDAPAGEVPGEPGSLPESYPAPTAGNASASGDVLFVPPPAAGGGDELRRLVSRVHGVFAVEAQAMLGALTGLEVTLAFDRTSPAEGLGGIDRMSPADRLGRTGDEACLTVSLEGLGALAWLHLDSTLVRALADRALGGPGIPSAPGRPLTGLERRLAGRGLQAVARALARSWQPWIAGELGSAVAVEDGPRQLAPQGEWICSRLQIRLGELDLRGQVAYAQATLARALGLAPDREPETAPAPALRPGLNARLEGLPLKVSFHSPDFSLTLREILAIEPGATIAIARSGELRVEARVEGMPRFRGRLVVDARGARTVAIEEPVGDALAGAGAK